MIHFQRRTKQMTLPDVVSRYIDAYNAKDVPGMIACLTRDVRFRNVSGGKIDVETHDRAAFAELAGIGAAALAERQQTVTNAITVFDTTLVEIDYRATVATDLPNGWTAGQVLAFRGASSFVLRGDLIASIVDVS